MLVALKEKFKKFPAGFYVMIVGFVGIFVIISLRQSHEKKRQEAFLSLFGEYEKNATPELLEELINKTSHSSSLKKRFGGRLLQEIVLFRPDILTKEWIKEPLKVKDNYDRFSEGSILIAENKLEDALLQGESLQKELTIEKSPALFAFNAFRIAVLHDKLGHLQEARKLFEAIMTETKVRDTLNNAYRFEAVSVSDYISDRLNTITDECE
jgi:hypothetical protein